jgi:hypothetical protein
VNYRVFVCSARDRKGVQSGKRSLFSKTRPSRAVPFPTISPNIFLKNKLFFLLPLMSKRATLYIDLHGRVCCFGAAKPGRREKARYIFALGPVVHSIHIQPGTVTPIQLNPPPSHLSPPALPARYSTLRSQLLQCTLIFCFSFLSPRPLNIIVFVRRLSPEDHTPREPCHVVSQILCAFDKVHLTKFAVYLRTYVAHFASCTNISLFLSRAPSAGHCIFFSFDGCRRRTTLTPREPCHIAYCIKFCVRSTKYAAHLTNFAVLHLRRYDAHFASCTNILLFHSRAPHFFRPTVVAGGPHTSRTVPWRVSNFVCVRRSTQHISRSSPDTCERTVHISRHGHRRAKHITSHIRGSFVTVRMFGLVEPRRGG